MPKSNALRKEAVFEHAPASTPAVEKAHDLERLIHEPVRLALVSALAANDSLTFSQIKALLNITDGNLSVHARKLEDAEYISCKKGFAGRMPQSVYRLTAKGRVAFEKYVDHMESIVAAMRTSIEKK
jgi:DNA-binding MarR family transcriptional regulator